MSAFIRLFFIVCIVVWFTVFGNSIKGLIEFRKAPDSWRESREGRRVGRALKGAVLIEGVAAVVLVALFLYAIVHTQPS